MRTADEAEPSPRWPGLGSAHRFAITSAAAFAVNLGVTVGIHELTGIRPSASYAVALTLVFLQSFLFLRFYVYGPQSSPWWRQFAFYAPSAAAFRGLEFIAFLVLEGVLAVDYRLGVMIVAGASFITKFIFYGRFIFRG